MEGLLLIILIAVVVVNVRKHNDKKNLDNVSEGKYDSAINGLQNYYSIIRQNAKDLGIDMIVISTYFFVIDGQVDCSSKLLAVSVRGVKNTALAEQLGMKAENINGEIEYRFALKGGYNLSTKKAILSEMSKQISEKYPNDVVNYDGSIPALFCMIDMKMMSNL